MASFSHAIATGVRTHERIAQLKLSRGLLQLDDDLEEGYLAALAGVLKLQSLHEEQQPETIAIVTAATSAKMMCFMVDSFLT